MRQAFADVLEFHRKFRPDLIGSMPKSPPPETTEFRIRLIQEEVDELAQAMRAGDLIGVADGIGDACYVLVGAAITYGIDLPAVFAEIHRSNLTKSLDERRPDGKVLKGPDFSPADVRGVLARQKPLLAPEYSPTTT